ncbi:hypothetical protein P0082_00875 [Candidatus Haliotispira prima]|uniref:Phage tail protein n=1 Tax=Candidatus Haliotispira prima TaxID=3034016 RepID=A0ABY8MHE8_9SPIO|nr:hypothetical protein P0082_00875 [Candidatus Haliotispira prima]
MGLDLRTTEQYRDALLALLPQGSLWDEERKNTDGELYRLCEVWAEEFTALEARLQEVIAEAGPLTADKTLDDWVSATGTSLLEGRKKIQRARTVAALTGKHASTESGISAIAEMMNYKLVFKPIVPADGVIGPTFGRMHCGERLWGSAHGLHRRMNISSKRTDFKVLKEQIDSQKVARLGNLYYGERLWQSYADIEVITNVSLYEIQTIKSLLPAHLIVEQVYV